MADSDISRIFKESRSLVCTNETDMSNTSQLTRLTPLLTESGGQHFFGFLNEADAATAARLRVWLGSASEREICVLADLLNQAVSNREVAGWWRVQDKAPEGPLEEENSQTTVSSHGQGVHRVVRSRTPARNVRQDAIRFIIIGFLLQCAGRIVAATGDAAALFGFVITLAGFVVFLGGCMVYASSKGYPKWIGLIGFLSCLGLFILALLPDRKRRT